MGVITAHRAPERVADGTGTRVWALMTDKCRRRLNEREGYITTEIIQSRGTKKKKKAQRKERGSWDARGVGSSRLRARGPFSLGRWAIRFCVFFTPKISRRFIRAQLLDPFSINSL